MRALSLIVELYTLIDEDQALRIEADLPGSPSLTPAGNVSAAPAQGRTAFFEPQPLAPQELPYRVVRDPSRHAPQARP